MTWSVDPWDYNGIAIGDPGMPIKHRKYGFDVMPPKRSPLIMHTDAWLGRRPLPVGTWVQVYERRDWESLLALSYPSGEHIQTRRITNGDEVIWQHWMRP